MAGYGNPEIEWQRIQDMVSRYGEPSEEPELQEPLPPFHDVRLYRFRFRCARTGTVHELNVSPAAHALWRGHGYPGIHNALPLMYGPPALGFVMPPFDPVFRHQLRQWPQQQQSQCQQPFPPAGIHPGAGPSTAVVPAPWEFPGSANHYNMLWVFGARPFDIQAPLQVYDGERIIWTDYGPENGRNVEALRLCHEEEGRSQLPIQLNKNVPARCKSHPPPSAPLLDPSSRRARRKFGRDDYRMSSLVARRSFITTSIAYISYSISQQQAYNLHCNFSSYIICDYMSPPLSEMIWIVGRKV